ncbi:hypothetical protein [Streptomyces acidiscabies]|uniref:Uncharacterized protein n=1 Tax=Streptomyces acidiscabies TaxID=42234 RepID=A0AAP6EK34_9ACTN|nr:hypothetical protein [Streptomyces acidiscabies]MBZ3916719.1 hypothetical protein [Streptomyces acidiscabies]MDX2965644.1 hypothetical protein [Streptomyces acidiscabies]MDX3024854.1 hypothetical protein [Streptomyces acidiscabies]MDX3795560.1 hypothetical protein [Streptomyces acidiscabies]
MPGFGDVEEWLITEESSGGLDWAYVLHPTGIEVIARSDHERGRLVDWTTDPQTMFSSLPADWRPATAPQPPQTTAPALPANVHAAQRR